MQFAKWLKDLQAQLRGGRLNPATAPRRHRAHSARPLDFCQLEERMMLSATSFNLSDLSHYVSNLNSLSNVISNLPISSDTLASLYANLSKTTTSSKAAAAYTPSGTLRRVDSSAPIQSGITTFVITHGLNGSASLPWITSLANTIKSIGAREHQTWQVLAFDWSYAANSSVNGTTLKYVKAVGQWAATKLASYGITGANLNLIGHSWGAYVMDELAEKIGGVNTIVALDPGQVIPVGYSESEVNFAAHSNWSWAFHASNIYGSSTTPGTADRAFLVQATDNWMGAAHNAVPTLFTRMIARTTGGVSQYFSLDDLLSSAQTHTSGDPWSLNRYGTNSYYEGVIATIGNTGSSPASITFIDRSSSASWRIDEVAPTISATAVDASAGETTGTANTGRIRISRSGGTSSAAMTVYYTVSGTATSGTDYTAIGGSVTIPAGKSYVDVMITPKDDTLAESKETVTITLSANSMYTLGTRKLATVNIADNEPTVSIVRSRNASETNPGTTGQGYFTVSRSGDLTKDVAVAYTISGTATSGADYAALTGTVTILAGQKTARIYVTPVNDNIVETSESVIVTLAAGTKYHLHPKATALTATMLIADSEPTVTLAVKDRYAKESADGKQTAAFVVTRTSSDLSQALVVNFSISGTATNGSDYTTLTGSVTIAAGARSATILIAPIDDTSVEPRETVVLSLDPSTTYRSAATAQTIYIDDWEPVVA